MRETLSSERGFRLLVLCFPFQGDSHEPNLAYGDSHLVSIGLTPSAFKIHAAQEWWHLEEKDDVYRKEFAKENRVGSVLWANKKDNALWFAPPAWSECRLKIQLLRLLLINGFLLSNTGYAEEPVKWTLAALERDGVGKGLKGFVTINGAINGVLGIRNHLHIQIKNYSKFFDAPSVLVLFKTNPDSSFNFRPINGTNLL
ncbi:hypothetical protein OROGR_029739 [Orobanche gracilis]